MSRTVRDLISSALTSAGAIAVGESASDAEAQDAVNELNNIIESFNLDEYYPYSNAHYDIPQPTSEISIGNEIYQETGLNTIEIYSTITLSNDITQLSDIPTFIDSVLTENGIKYSVSNSIANTGTILNPITGAEYVISNGIPFSWNSIDFNAGDIVQFINSDYILDNLSPIYYYADIIAESPDRLIAVNILRNNALQPLRYIEPNSFYNAHRNQSLTEPAYYTYERNYPNTDITIYPTNSQYPIQITSQIVKSTYDINDDLELPGGYYPALQYELATILALNYGNLELVPGLEVIAKKRLAAVKRLNNKGRMLKPTGAPGRGRSYDIYTNTGGY
jgi:hypothetical protein